jgi:hypothetical protein
VELYLHFPLCLDVVHREIFTFTFIIIIDDTIQVESEDRDRQNDTKCRVIRFIFIGRYPSLIRTIATLLLLVVVITAKSETCALSK